MSLDRQNANVVTHRKKVPMLIWLDKIRKDVLQGPIYMNMQIKLRQWVFDKRMSAKQIAITPSIDIFWDDDVTEDKNTVVCVSFAWLAWCIEWWINPSKVLR